jgi:DNA polymerase-3 subunit gamma/tau
LGLAPDEYAALTMVLLRLLAFKPDPVRQPLAEKKTLKSHPAEVQPVVAVPMLRPARAELPVPVVTPAPVATVLPPPGQQLHVVSPRVAAGQPLVSEQNRASSVVNAAPAVEKIVAIPVRVQSESRSDAVTGQAASVLLPTEEGEFWHSTVQQLIADDAITAMVRELALQSQLVARDTDQWILRVERESLNQSGSRDRLATALQAVGHDVRLAVEIGRVSDSPARRNMAQAAERQLAAEKVIFEDPFVQTMMRDFGAKIVPGSIKPG